jgi:hypothetical protein
MAFLCSHLLPSCLEAAPKPSEIIKNQHHAAMWKKMCLFTESWLQRQGHPLAREEDTTSSGVGVGGWGSKLELRPSMLGNAFGGRPGKRERWGRNNAFQHWRAHSLLLEWVLMPRLNRPCECIVFLESSTMQSRHKLISQGCNLTLSWFLDYFWQLSLLLFLQVLAGVEAAACRVQGRTVCTTLIKSLLSNSCLIMVCNDFRLHLRLLTKTVSNETPNL